MEAHVFSCDDLDGDTLDWVAVHLDDKGTGDVRIGLTTIWQTFQGSNSMTDLPALSGSLKRRGSVMISYTIETGLEMDDRTRYFSPFANVNGVTGTGRVQLFINNNDAFTKLASIVGSRKHEWLGYRLTSGDINGDGRLEMAVTAFEESNSLFNSGLGRGRQTIDG